MKTLPHITIFTPTYNRAHTLPRLYESLKRQTVKDFEWLVIDDGSTDDTHKLMMDWLDESNEFKIRYYYVENGGKNRALNKGIKYAEGKYFMILDSDDLLTHDSVEFILTSVNQVADNEEFIGISGKKGKFPGGLPLGVNSDSYSEDGYLDCNNLERKKYGLERDMAEVFVTEILRKYEFKVWPGEKFTPEEVVWNQMALDGYKLRWFNKVTYLCEYQVGGLSDSTWSLMQKNPMGYAMMFNQRLLIDKSLRGQVYNALQYTTLCILGKQYGAVMRSNCLIITCLLMPVAFCLAKRRRRQFNSK